MSKRPVLARIRSRLNARTQEGAGALLPIIVIGAIIIAVSASTAAGVTFSSKISSAQTRSSENDNYTRSLFNYFEAAAYNSNWNKGSTAPRPVTTVDGLGTFKIYYSTNATAPTSTTTSGVTELNTTTALPSTTKWLLVVATPTGGASKTAVYSYLPRASTAFDSAVNWRGPVTVTGSGSEVKAAPGVSGAVSFTGRESSSTASTQGMSIDSGKITADVYASYTTKATALTGSTIRGNIYSKSSISYSNTPKVYGDASTSSSSNIGTPDNEGGVYTSATAPAIPGQTAGKVGLPTTVATLVAADCSSAALLKSKLESLTTSGTVTGINNCASSSWTTTIKPKVDLVLSSSSTTATQSISNLTISGPKRVSIHAQGGLTLNSVNYLNGSSGQILTAGSASITNSTLVGAVGNYNTNGGTLSLGSTKVLYSPVLSNLCTNAAGTTGCNAISSTDLHLIRVS